MPPANSAWTRPPRNQGPVGSPIGQSGGPNLSPKRTQSKGQAPRCANTDVPPEELEVAAAATAAPTPTFARGSGSSIAGNSATGKTFLSSASSSSSTVVGVGADSGSSSSSSSSAMAAAGTVAAAATSPAMAGNISQQMQQQMQQQLQQQMQQMQQQLQMQQATPQAPGGGGGSVSIGAGIGQAPPVLTAPTLPIPMNAQGCYVNGFDPAGSPTTFVVMGGCQQALIMGRQPSIHQGLLTTPSPPPPPPAEPPLDIAPFGAEEEAPPAPVDAPSSPMLPMLSAPSPETAAGMANPLPMQAMSVAMAQQSPNSNRSGLAAPPGTWGMPPMQQVASVPVAPRQDVSGVPPAQQTNTLQVPVMDRNGNPIYSSRLQAAMDEWRTPTPSPRGGVQEGLLHSSTGQRAWASPRQRIGDTLALGFDQEAQPGEAAIPSDVSECSDEEQATHHSCPPRFHFWLSQGDPSSSTKTLDKSAEAGKVQKPANVAGERLVKASPDPIVPDVSSDAASTISCVERSITWSHCDVHSPSVSHREFASDRVSQDSGDEVLAILNEQDRGMHVGSGGTSQDQSTTPTTATNTTGVSKQPLPPSASERGSSAKAALCLNKESAGEMPRLSSCISQASTSASVPFPFPLPSSSSSSASACASASASASASAPSAAATAAAATYSYASAAAASASSTSAATGSTGGPVRAASAAAGKGAGSAAAGAGGANKASSSSSSSSCSAAASAAAAAASSTARSSAKLAGAPATANDAAQGTASSTPNRTVSAPLGSTPSSKQVSQKSAAAAGAASPSAKLAASAKALNHQTLTTPSGLPLASSSAALAASLARTSSVALPKLTKADSSNSNNNNNSTSNSNNHNSSSSSNINSKTQTKGTSSSQSKPGTASKVTQDLPEFPRSESLQSQKQPKQVREKSDKQGAATSTKKGSTGVAQGQQLQVQAQKKKGKAVTNPTAAAGKSKKTAGKGTGESASFAGILSRVNNWTLVNYLKRHYIIAAVVLIVMGILIRRPEMQSGFYPGSLIHSPPSIGFAASKGQSYFEDSSRIDAAKAPLARPADKQTSASRAKSSTTSRGSNKAKGQR